MSSELDESQSLRLWRNRSLEDLMADLKRYPPNASPATIEEMTRLGGYPGTLTPKQLEECLSFVRDLHAMPEEVADQVYWWRDVEDQASTICRYLRATDFDAPTALQRCQDHQAGFDRAKAHSFYGPNLHDHLGCPESVLVSQLGMILCGRGKNHCPVYYLRVGTIQPEGILCLVTLEQLEQYYWFRAKYRFQPAVQASQHEQQEFVPCASININDYSGFSMSSMTADSIEFGRIDEKMQQVFPEAIDCLLGIHTPWMLTILAPLTQYFLPHRWLRQRVTFCSRASSSQYALEQVLSHDQIPLELGGGGPSLEEVRKECQEPGILRQDIQLLDCSQPNSQAQLGSSDSGDTPSSWTLASDESLQVSVYTRSVANATVEVLLDGTVLKSCQVQCQFVRTDEPEEREEGSSTPTNPTKPHPQKVVVISSLTGPGSVTVQVQDLGAPVSNDHAKCSRGYFLVVGDVTKTKTTTAATSV